MYNIDISDYELHSIDHISEENEDIKTVDIEVEEDHTFFIFDENTEELILSHNCDGILIRGLLNTFFYKFCPKLLKEGRICYLQTPMIVGYKNKKVSKLFFSFQDYMAHVKSDKKLDEYFYAKGLGTWKKEQLQEIFKEYGLDNFIFSFKYVDNSDKAINDWMSGKTSDIRKEYLRGKEFDVEKI